MDVYKSPWYIFNKLVFYYRKTFFLTYSENTFKAKNVVDLFFGSKYFFFTYAHPLIYIFVVIYSNGVGQNNVSFSKQNLA